MFDQLDRRSTEKMLDQLGFNGDSSELTNERRRGGNGGNAGGNAGGNGGNGGNGVGGNKAIHTLQQSRNIISNMVQKNKKKVKDNGVSQKTGKNATLKNRRTRKGKVKEVVVVL